jgi:Ca2+-binding EF-hand superfamily protein
MRRTLLIVAAAALFAASAQAQDTRVAEFQNLFISPSGEPFFAPKSEAYPIVKWFNGADANHDGKLDIDEMRNDAARFFQVLDRNKDGVVDNLEVNYYENRMVPQILAPRDVGAIETGIIRVDMQASHISPDSPNPDPMGLQQGASFYSLFQEPEPVRSADRNFDQRITLTEFLAHSDRHFHALDRDNKGYLTLADLPKTAAEKDAKAHR